MKIIFISQYFWPENFRINELCEEFHKLGHTVTILTGKPNYPGGKVFPDFIRDPKQYSEYRGCNVLRVPMCSRGHGGGFKLTLNYLSFALSASTIGVYKLRKQDADIIFVFEPSPITVGLPAIVLKKLKNIPIVFWVLDLWPQTLKAVGAVNSKVTFYLIGKLVTYIYNRCDLILGQSKAFKKEIALYCSKKHKIEYFPNWAESIFFNDVPPEITEIDGDQSIFKILFAGNIGESQDFSSVLKAIETLKGIKAKVRLYLVGDGRALPWVENQIVKRKLGQYVDILGRYPLEKMPAYFNSVDALLVSLKPSEVFSKTIPGKIQSYMAAGKPILAMLDGEGARVINDARAGLTCSSGDYSNLAHNMLKMSSLSKQSLAKMGSNAKDYASQEFDRKKLFARLEKWLEEEHQLNVKKSKR